MKLYVCWGVHREPFHRHPCRAAYKALEEAGHDPDVVKVRGLGVGPRIFQWTTEGRREVERISGQRAVPALVTSAGQVIVGSGEIADWAGRNPAAAAEA